MDRLEYLEERKLNLEFRSRAEITRDLMIFVYSITTLVLSAVKGSAALGYYLVWFLSTINIILMAISYMISVEIHDGNNNLNDAIYSSDRYAKERLSDKIPVLEWAMEFIDSVIKIITIAIAITYIIASFTN